MTLSLLQLQPPTRLDEQRHHPRVVLRRRVWCEHRDWTLYLALANLSLEGMFIQTSAVFAPGEQLRVSLADTRSRIVAEVEVVWASSRGRLHGVGCRVREIREGAEHYVGLLEMLCNNAR